MTQAMDNKKQAVNIYKLAKAFEKIYKGFSGKQKEELNIIERDVLAKAIPSENSEVYMLSGYDEEYNSISIDVYVTNSQTEANQKDITLDKIMFEYLLRADITKLSNISECIDLMDNAGSDKYSIDGIPASFDSELNEYYLHFVITKIR